MTSFQERFIVPSHQNSSQDNGYFTRLGSSCFGRDANGNALFFRIGPLSRPYVLPDRETEQRLRALSAGFYRRLVVGSAVLLLVFPLLPLYWGALIAWFVSKTSPLLQGLPRQSDRLTITAALRTRAMAYPALLLASAAVAFAIATIAATIGFKVTSNADLRFVLALAIPLCVAGTAATTAMWRFRKCA